MAAITSVSFFAVFSVVTMLVKVIADNRDDSDICTVQEGRAYMGSYKLEVQVFVDIGDIGTDVSEFFHGLLSLTTHVRVAALHKRGQLHQLWYAQMPLKEFADDINEIAEDIKNSHGVSVDSWDNIVGYMRADTREKRKSGIVSAIRLGARSAARASAKL